MLVTVLTHVETRQDWWLIHDWITSLFHFLQERTHLLWIIAPRPLYSLGNTECRLLMTHYKHTLNKANMLSLQSERIYQQKKWELCLCYPILHFLQCRYQPGSVPRNECCFFHCSFSRNRATTDRVGTFTPTLLVLLLITRLRERSNRDHIT